MNGTIELAEHRPISVMSVFIGLYHSILGSRLESALPINSRQQGFKRGDGIFLNSAILSKCLSTAKLRLAFIDVSKAFNSVRHNTLWLACKRMGIHPHLINHFRRFYADSYTRLGLGEKKSEPIQPMRGIRQGDPLLLHLFNAVVDMCTDKLDSDTGFDLESDRLTFMAYADDIILFAKTRAGLKHNFEILKTELRHAGLAINARISAMLSIRSHKKKWICDNTNLLQSLVQPQPVTPQQDFLNKHLQTSVRHPCSRNSVCIFK